LTNVTAELIYSTAPCYTMHPTNRTHKHKNLYYTSWQNKEWKNWASRFHGSKYEDNVV